MKNYLLILLPFLLLTSCADIESDNGITSTKGPITYRSNSPSVKANGSITLEYNNDGVVTAKRTYGPLKEEDPSSMMYFETEVNAQTNEIGQVKISDNKGDLWFIPFMVSTPPVLISTDANKCITYYCACGGVGGPVAGCVAINTGQTLHCRILSSEACTVGCAGYAVEGPCNSAQLDFNHVYTGGVFVRGKKVNIIDPPGYEYDKKQAEGIKMFVLPDGSLIDYDIAVRERLVKPTDPN